MDPLKPDLRKKKWSYSNKFVYGNKPSHTFDDRDNVKLISIIISRTFLKHNGWVTQQGQEGGVCPAGSMSVGWFKREESSWRGSDTWRGKQKPSVWKTFQSCQASFSCCLTPGGAKCHKWRVPLMLCRAVLLCRHRITHLWSRQRDWTT